MAACASPFSIDFEPAHPIARLAMRGIAPAIERATGLSNLARLYAQHATEAVGAAFFADALALLGVPVETAGPGIGHLPAEGPLVVVANHPLGALDGLAVGRVVTRVRSDVKVLGNSLLARIPELAPVCVAVDLYRGAEARTGNAVALRQAIRWVRDGHALVVFPAGRVSDTRSTGEQMVDAQWSPVIARVVASAKATVVPVFVDASASRWLHAAGRVHWALRTALLPRELLRHRGRPVSVVVGRPFDADRAAREETPEAAAAYLRARTYALAPAGVPALPDAARLASAADARTIESELASLPRDATLVASGAWRVVVGRARDLPETLAEIGRLRELTFRLAGEGTGRSRDLDAHDQEYLHLVAWNSDDRRIAGAYRMGPTDEIRTRWRSVGLYTRTLFRYGSRLLDELGPALELGRAFVVPEYQREFAPLAMLWKGIGAYVARHPRYRRLFGPVSLSADYPEITRQLMVAFLERRALAPEWASYVSPRRPFTVKGTDIQTLAHRASLAEGLDEVDALVKELDSSGRGLPVLLRQYLKLKARVLTFSVDPDFGGVVDGLMVVDLLEVPAPVLTRYMGREGYRALLAHHRRSGDLVAAPPGMPGLSVSAVSSLRSR